MHIEEQQDEPIPPPQPSPSIQDVLNTMNEGFGDIRRQLTAIEDKQRELGYDMDTLKQ